MHPPAGTSMVGFGDPVLDLVVHVSYETLKKLDFEPGGCCHISHQKLSSLLSMSDVAVNLKKRPGGSAANVCRCFAALHSVHHPKFAAAAISSVYFIGMVGQDGIAAEYESMMAAQGVSPLLLRSSTALESATCMCLVTPDGQRTMRTFLGAAQDLTHPHQIEDIMTSHFGLNGCVKVAHFEGYSLFKSEVTAAAMKQFRTKGALISLDLASFEVVRNCWDALSAILKEGLVDVVFANEDESACVADLLGSATTAVDDGLMQKKASAVQTAQDHLIRFVQVAVISRGRDGACALAADGRQATAVADDVHVIDTVGAGDFFSAGFLCAYVKRAPLDACLACGCAAGSAAVQVPGAFLDERNTERLRERVQSILSNCCNVRNG